MKKLLSSFLPLLLLLPLTGCYRTVIRTPAEQSGEWGERRGYHFVDGITDAEHELPCPHGIATVEVYRPALAYLLEWFTMGIVSSTELKFTCAR